MRKGPAEVERTLKLTFALCATAAGAALLVLGVAVSWRAGAALAAGLLIGSANGFLADLTLGVGFFSMLGLGRLGLLTGVGVLVGLALGVQYLWLVALGLALAQAALAVAAAREVLQQR
jgi:hypothetical protein